jgi:hypothetical protein
MLQIEVQDLDTIQRSLSSRNWPIYESLKDVWFRAGQYERGLWRLLVQDPDGYLVMVYEEIGIRRMVQTD